MRISYGEAIDHVMTLMSLPGSHLHAELKRWRWPATDAELAAIRHAEWYMNVHRNRKIAPDPIELEFPWTGVKEIADVTPAEREELRAVLIASSPFQH